MIHTECEKRSWVLGACLLARVGRDQPGAVLGLLVACFFGTVAFLTLSVGEKYAADETTSPAAYPGGCRVGGVFCLPEAAACMEFICAKQFLVS